VLFGKIDDRKGHTHVHVCRPARGSSGCCAIIMDQTLSSLSGRNVLLGVTGSVAAVKAPALVRQWQADGAHVQVLLTQGGRNFWDRAAAYENGTDYDDRGPRWLPPDVQIHGECTFIWTRHTREMTEAVAVVECRPYSLARCRLILPLICRRER
jgi:hypothetical protein